MPLISCLRKVGSFDKEEQDYILAKSKALQEEKGMSANEAELTVVKELQTDLLSSLKSIYNQLDLSTTKEVKSVAALNKEGLKPMRIAYKKDKTILEEEDYNKLSKGEKEGYKEIVKPAQVIISWNLRDKTGKLVKPDDYMTLGEDGVRYLDMKKVPKEILNQFGFRIPNQGHNSMSLIEVVGFLPDTYAGIVIASRNFITQMGSDFDVDKLYIYNYFLDSDSEGNLKKEEGNTQNELVDIHKSVLYNPRIFDSVVKPLDLGKLKYKTKDGKDGGVAVELKALEDQTVNNYLNPDYSKNKYLQSVDGKAMVGLTSTSSVFSTLMQGKNIVLQKAVQDEDKTIFVNDFIIFDIEGKATTFGDLSSAYTRTGRKKNEIHQSIQSAAVDNEKDPILSYINVNPQTSSVLTLLIDLGLEEKDIYLFLRQPLIVEYANQVKLSKSGLATEFKREEDILLDLIESIKPIADKLKTRLGVAELADVPVGERHFRQVLFGTGETNFTNDEIKAIVIEKFAKAKSYGDYLQRTQNLLNIESKGVGKSILDLADKRRNIDKALSSKMLRNIEAMVGTMYTETIEPSTITGHALVNSIYAADDVITESQLMPFSTEMFNNVVSQYEDIIGRETNAEQKYEIWKAVKAYTYAKIFSKAERQRIFFDSKENKSLSTRITNAKIKLKNNPFVLRLDLSKVDLSGKTPSYVFYNSAKEEDVEELGVYQGLIELLYSKDPELASIGQDLIKYYYLNGGSPTAKDWGRYIDKDMLDIVGLTPFIESVNFSAGETYGYKKGLSDVLLQLFQHKQYLAPRLIDKSNMQVKQDTVLFPHDKLPRELIRGEGVTPIFNFEKALYKHIGQNKDGQIYKIIPQLGRKFYQDYTNTEVVTKVEAPTIAENKPAYEEKITPETPATEYFGNPFVDHQFDDIIGVDLEQALFQIRRNDNDYHRLLAETFNNLKAIIGDIQVESFDDSNLPPEQRQSFFGRWDGKTIKINLNELAKHNKLTREYVESTILKETIHAIHAKLFRSEFTPTPEQLAAKKAIVDIFESFKKRVLNGELSHTWNPGTFTKFEELLNKAKKDGKLDLSLLTTEEKEFLYKNKPLYYGLMNVEDFLHDVLLQPELRDQLNTLNYDSGKTLLGRLHDLIVSILNAFKEVLPINKRSYLEAALYNTIKLTQTPLETKQQKKEGFQYNEQQTQAIEETIEFVRNGKEPFMLVEGKAGTGKTTIAQEVAKAFPTKRIVVAALSHKAKGVIRDKFEEAKITNATHYSLAGLLGQKLDMETGMFARDENAKEAPIEMANIIIIDEASMINEEALSYLLSMKGSGAKLIFLGDIGQLPPIRTLQNPYYKNRPELLSNKSPVFDTSKKAILTERVRQGEASPILPFADYFWENSQKKEPVANPAATRENKITKAGALIFTNGFDAIKENVIEAFKTAVKNKNPNHIKVVTYKNATRQAINSYVHNTLFPNQPEFNQGELIIFNDTYGKGDDAIENSAETQVTYVSEVKTDSVGLRYVNITAPINEGVETFPVIIAEDKAKFKEILADEFNKAWALKPRDRQAYLKQLRKAWDLKAAYANIDYAYAITSHKSQGSTYNMVVVDERDINSVGPIGNKEKSESIYTALTRAKNVAIIISSTPTPAITSDIESINNQIETAKTAKDTSDDIFYDLAASNTEEEEEILYKSIINDYEVRLKSIGKDISKARAEGDKENATALKNRYDEVKAERDNLIAENSLDAILKTANNDLDYIKKLQQNPELSSSDLAYIRTVLGTWTNIANPDIYEVLTNFDVENSTPKALAVDAVVQRANSLKNILDQQQISILKKLAEGELERSLAREQITKVKDISGAQSKFRDITSSDNVVLSVIDKWVRTAEFKLTTELNQLIATAEALTKGVNDKGVSTRADFARVFGQELENGELTGEIVDALKAEYYLTREALLKKKEEAVTAEEQRKASENYYNWIKDNHIIVQTSKLYTQDADGILIYKEDAAYLAELEKQLGEDFAKTVAYAKEVTEHYNELLRQELVYYKGRADAELKLSIWRLENSPLIYLDNLMNGLTVRKIEGKVIYNKGWKYISKRVKAEWEDAKYNELQKDADLKAYYDWYKTTLKTLYEYLPYNIRTDLKTTEIPNIEKQLAQEIHDAGITKVVNRTWSAFLDEISVSKNEPTGLIDPATGTFMQDFQFAYLDKLNPNHKSYDLTQTLKLFAAQAIGYKYKSQVEDQVRLAEAVLKNSLEKQMAASGLPKTDKFGKTTTTKGLRNLYDQLDYVIDVFYGKRKDTREGQTNTTYITPRDKERLKEEEAEIDKLDIPEALKEAKKLALRDKYTKRLTWSKVGDALLQYSQLKGMGWNVFGGVNNALFGQLANYNWAATGVDFSDEDINKAVGLMLMAQSPVDSDTKKKIEALMIKFNTVKQLRDKIYSATTNYNKARKGMQKLAPYELYAQGEYFIQGQVMVALLNATKVDVVENGETKSISLFDALNDQGEWDAERFGANEKWSNLGKSTMNFKFKLDTLLKKIHGNYDPNSAMLINKKWFGRALIQFRRWIPEGMAQRFDSEKYDEYLQRHTKGRYRTYYDLGFGKSVSTLAKTALYRGHDKAFEGLGLEGEALEIAKENMKKNLREVYFKLSMMALYLILSGLDDDDDDYATRAFKNYAINTIFRLEDDIEFYYSPIAFENITRSALPVANLISDSAKLVDAISDTLAGEGTYKTGIHSGDSKILWRGLKVLPFGSSVSGLISKTETTEAFRK